MRLSCLVLLFILMTGNCCLGGVKNDSILNKKIEDLQAKITDQNAAIHDLKVKADNNDANAALLISHTGTFLTVLTIIFTLASFLAGGTGYVTYKSAKDSKNDAAIDLKEIKTTKSEINAIKEEILPVKSNLLAAEQAQIIAKNNFDLKAEELTEKINSINENLEETSQKWEIDKQNIIDFSLACEKLEEGAITNAQSIFLKIIERDPKYYHAKCKIAMCKSSMDDDDHALRDIEKLIHEFPGECCINSTKGVILRRLKEYDEAIESFEKLIVEDRQDKQSTFTHIGYCYLYKRDYDKSIENFEKGKVDKSSPAFYGLVKAHLLKTKTVPPELLKEALSISDHDIMENPKYPYHNFGAAFLRLCETSANGDFDKYLSNALSSCKNLGILKEQLFEYELIENNGIVFEKLAYTIKAFSESIKEVKENISNYKKVVSKNPRN
jgi:tetratricopeptide (TPR) repeat protein